MDPYYGWWWHGFGLMWIIPLGFLIVLAILLLRGGPGYWFRGYDRGEGRESAREILDRRYASGEISKEQYEDMKRVLKG